MCVFVGGIERVSATKIFAALGADGRQRLVYSMDLETAREVAMILPLPVARDAGKDALRFVDLSAYPEIFDDLVGLFDFGAGAIGSEEGSADFVELSTLPVHQVGDFEASYVPSHDDWERLDPRFRLDPTLWEQLGQYDEAGFAVFQLSPAADAGAQRVHPMALEFASATPGQLFFPTVHIHDGRVHGSAEFDHDLYCQLPDGHPILESFDQGDGLFLLDFEGWMHSGSVAGKRVDAERAAGLVDGAAPVLLRQVHGQYPNRDFVVEGLAW